MLWNKVGAGIFKHFYFLGKFLGLVALEYDFKNKVFQTSLKATLMSSVICIFVAVMSPFIVKLNSKIYHVSGVDIDENMSLITEAQFGFGFATSFIVLVCQIWKRNSVCSMTRNFQKVLNTLSSELGYMGYSEGNVITPEIILLIAIKFSITMYEVLINFPYIIQYGDIISVEWFVAFFVNLYIAEIAAVFSDIVFAAMLLLARYFYLLDELFKALEMEIQAEDEDDRRDDNLTHQRQIHEHRKKLLRLMRLYWQMRRMVDEFARCIEVSILVQMLNTFANMLTNLYALLDFYVQDELNVQNLMYNVMIFVNIFLLIHAAERIKRSSEDLRNTLVNLDASRGCKNSEWSSDVLRFKMWPEVFEVDVLRLFLLNNTFFLFLVSYSINFVVIILQSIMIKAIENEEYEDEDE